MKLRLRSAETKETIRIEVPTPCTLQHLREILYQRLPSSPSFLPASIHLSLNRKDELRSSSPEEDSLQSQGITSGDLIFFTLNLNGFSSETLTTHSQTHHLPSSSLPKLSENLDANSGKNPTPCLQSLNLETRDEKNLDFGSTIQEIVENTEIDKGEPEVDIGKSFSVPGFLRKVFTKELGNDGGRDHKLMVIAVHAVLLESGFLAFDPASNKRISGFPFSEAWPSFAFRMTLSYTLPQIISRGCDNADVMDYVVLKFVNLEKFINVYGSLPDGSATYRVMLDESKLVPFLNVTWANCGLTEDVNGQNGFSGTTTTTTTPEKEVFMFWRTVKDRIALPLLIDLCEKSGLPLPSCFMLLPTDLKIKILELLSGVDLAKMSCLCSELRYVGSRDDLWKQKFLEEFGDGDSVVGRSCWKDRFANCWQSRKKRKLASFEQVRRGTHPFFFRTPAYPVIGGDYDLFPLGLPSPFGRHGRAGPRTGGFLRHCGLEGR